MQKMLRFRRLLLILGVGALLLETSLYAQSIVTHSYDDAGRLTSVAYDDSSITYVYDALGNLLHIRVEGDEAVLVVDRLVVDVPEGTTAGLSVKLSQAPAATTNVTVSRVSGDTDLSITSGASLSFSPTDWDVFQPVTFAAAQDGDATNGTATFVVQSPGLPDVVIVVREVDDEAPACSYTLDRTSGDFVVQGGSDAVNVTTSPSCAWTAVSQAVWISVDSGLSYTGTATVTYTVAENTASSSRTGTLTIAGETFTVHQTGTSDDYSVSVVRTGTGDGSVTSAPGGISCGASCSASFSQGTTVVLTASPAAGSRFVGWSGPCSGIGTCTIDVQGHTTVTAVFDEIIGFDIISTRPASGDTGVAIRVTISVVFNDVVQAGPAFNTIELRDDGGTVVPLAVYVYPDHHLALLDPQARLEYGTGYTLTMPAAAFQNAAGDALAGDVVVPFTTIDLAAPRLVMAADSRWLLEGKTLGASVWFDRRSDTARVVTLTKSGTGQLTFPSQVTIEAGQLKADFSVTATQDSVNQGDRSTTLMATASTGEQASFVFDVHEDDTSNSGAIRLSGGWLQDDDDGDGLFEAGERADLIAQVTNYGSTWINQVELTGEVLDTFEIRPLGDPPHGSVYNLAPGGGTRTDNIRLVAGRDTPTGRYHVRVRGTTSGSLSFESYLPVDVVNDALPDFRVTDGNASAITVDPGWIGRLEYHVVQHADGFNTELPSFVVYMETDDGVETIYESYSVVRGYFETEETFEVRVEPPTAPGTYRVWAEVNVGGAIVESDSTNNVSEDILITVREPNDPPVLNPIADGSVAAGRLFSIVATASDPDLGQSLTFDLTSAPLGAAIQPDTGVFSWSPAPDLAPGSYPVTVRVTDDGSTMLSDSKTFYVTVFQEADVSVAQTNGLFALVPGQDVTYEVTVANLGPSVVSGVSVVGTPTALLTGIAWTCTAAAGSLCPASGAGAVSASVDLAVQGSVVFTVSGRVTDGSSGTLVHEVTATVPAAVEDPVAGNDVSRESDTLLALDYGDAPDEAASASSWHYPTRRAEDGARHGITGLLMLGGAVDGEADGQPSIDGLADDTTGADEDGIVFTTPLAVCETASLEVTSTAAGFLDGWIDWDADGRWAPPGEQVFAREPLLPGANALTIAVPCAASPVAETFARFRLSTSGGLDPTGLALDGEVEDYRVAVYGRDFADAADPAFPTLLASDGARHVLSDGLRLGSLADAEPDGLPDAAALGDDGDGTDDEDGVAFVSQLIPGQNATIQVSASATGFLDAWIDWNGNGDWGDPLEKIFSDEPVPAGTHDLSFLVPAAAKPDIVTTARFRLSIAGGLSVSGLAYGGEVEDYSVQMAGVADLAVSKSNSKTAVSPGEPVVYSIIVYNDGPSPVVGARVGDSLPAILSGATWSCTSSTGATCTAQGIGDIDDLVSLPVGGSATYSVTANTDASALGSLENTVTVAPPPGVFDPVPDNNSATDVDPLLVTADLVVSMAGESASVLPGQRVTYLLSITNLGPSSVTRVTVQDLAPSALTAVSWACSPVPGVTCTAEGTGDLVDSVALPAGKTVTYSYTGVLVDGASSLTNTVDVLVPAGVVDPVPENNSSTHVTSLRGIDYGDAPDVGEGPQWHFPTRLVDDGARHGVVEGMALGDILDAEADGQPDVGASGDDATGDPSDEDGINFLGDMQPCQTVPLEVRSSASGLLSGWVDFNSDGDWDEVDDEILTDEPVAAGINSLMVSVPCGATPGSTYGRFRLSSGRGLSYVGLAPDGEVEDYLLVIAPIPYTLSVSTSGSGAGVVTIHPGDVACEDGCIEKFPGGTEVTLTASPALGSVFTGWSGPDCMGAASCTLTMDANKAVTAHFDLILYSLQVTLAGSGTGNVSSMPAGITCGDDCSESFAFGTQVSLTAREDNGSVFSGWSGADCIGANACAVTIDAAKTVAAFFDVLVPCNLLTLSKTGEGSSPEPVSDRSPGCDLHYYHPGEVVNLTARPADGHRVAGWTGTNDDASIALTNTVDMPSVAYEVTVHYVPPVDLVVALVDDDDNVPDVRSIYLDALASLPTTFELAIWDTENSDDEPTSLSQFDAVIWFTGAESGGFAGPGTNGEAMLAAYLDGGGCLLLSSQDYLSDRGRGTDTPTPFMTTYLGVETGTSDEEQTVVTGVGPFFRGMGPFTLSYPFTNGSDVLTPAACVAVEWWSEDGAVGLSKQGDTYKATFLSFPLEALPTVQDRREVLQRFLDWCAYGIYGDGFESGNLCAWSAVTSSAPVVEEVLPLQAVLGVSTLFTVKGRGLPPDVSLWIDRCEGMVEISGGDSTERQFVCVPSQVLGQQGGMVTINSTGVTLLNFVVNVVTRPQVAEVKPLQAELGIPTVFTVTGNNLPADMGFWIGECEGVRELPGGDSAGRLFECTPSYTLGEKPGVLKVGEGGTLLLDFTVEVINGPGV